METNIGEEVIFTCESNNKPIAPNWFFDQRLINNYEDNIYDNGSHSILIIDSAKSYHSGTYTCVAIQDFSYNLQFFATAILKVFGKQAPHIMRHHL